MSAWLNVERWHGAELVFSGLRTSDLGDPYRSSPRRRRSNECAVDSRHKSAADTLPPSGAPAPDMLCYLRGSGAKLKSVTGLVSSLNDVLVANDSVSIVISHVATKATCHRYVNRFRSHLENTHTDQNDQLSRQHKIDLIHRYQFNNFRPAIRWRVLRPGM